MSLLDQAQAHFAAGTLMGAWAKANPGEAIKLATYMGNGGAPPVLATHTGQAFVLVEQARRAMLPATSVLPPGTP